MNSTSQFLGSLESILKLTPLVKYQDEFKLLNIEVENLTNGLIILKKLLEELDNGRIIEYERAVVQIAKEGNQYDRISLPFRFTKKDIILTSSILERDWCCSYHKERYDDAYHKQNDENELPEWYRYILILEIIRCNECKLISWVEISFDKEKIEKRIKKSILSDIPKFKQNLDNIRIIFWASLNNFYSQIDKDPFSTYTTLAKLNKPCLFICLENAENDGSDYFKTISIDKCLSKETIEPIIGNLKNAPLIKTLTKSRKNQIEDFQGSLGYLPPEYWINSSVLTFVQSDGILPNWFNHIASFFVLSILTSISTTTSIVNGKIKFIIKRESELVLNIKLFTKIIEIHDGTNVIPVNLNRNILNKLMNLYSTTLQGKYSSINQDLVQKSIVYGTGFSYDKFFEKLDQIIKFYEFEYNHLLGDRFEQQSRTLSSFVSDMMAIRQQLGSLIDSLSKDLSNLAITIFATTALSILAKIIDINSWINLFIYGIFTCFAFVYFYIWFFQSRIDNLLHIGERAVDNSISDIERGQQIWDYPLHLIGIEEKDLNKENILKPLASQHHINQIVGEITGFTAHLTSLVLAIIVNYWWFPVSILIIDSIFLGFSILKKSKRERIIYYLFNYLITLLFVGKIIIF